MKRRIPRAKERIRSAANPLRDPLAYRAWETPAKPYSTSCISSTTKRVVLATEGEALVGQDAPRAIPVSPPRRPFCPSRKRSACSRCFSCTVRRPARTDADGDLVPLEQQDRSLWGWRGKREGLRPRWLPRSPVGRFGPYTLQAAIATVHARAVSVGSDGLGSDCSPLRHAAGESAYARRRAQQSDRRGDAGRAGSRLLLVDALLHRGELADYLPAQAARADLDRRLGAATEATRAYLRALEGPQGRNFRIRFFQVVPSSGKHDYLTRSQAARRRPAESPG